MNALPWRCSADIEISGEQLDAIERLQARGVIAGGVTVEPTTDEATYRYLTGAGTAQIKVTGDEGGVVFIRWDGAWRDERTPGFPEAPKRP